jgi:uncharacterized protein YndB with AHSA1/START domain
MATFTVTTFINRPLQEVFDFMTNPANFAQWQSGTKSAKWAAVVGTDYATSTFHDGQLIEVDGNAGTVRVVVEEVISPLIAVAVA